jgi:hypothetical protein
MSTDLVRHGNKKDERAVPAKAKIAIQFLLQQPKADLQAAALAAGIQSTKLLRHYLRRAEVQRYLREERKALLSSVVGGNILALKEVRDESANHNARVNAARALSLMENEMDDPGYANRHAPEAPGVTIVIQTGDGARAQPADNRRGAKLACLAFSRVTMDGAHGRHPHCGA